MENRIHGKSNGEKLMRKWNQWEKPIGKVNRKIESMEKWSQWEKPMGTWNQLEELIGKVNGEN